MERTRVLRRDSLRRRTGFALLLAFVAALAGNGMCFNTVGKLGDVGASKLKAGSGPSSMKDYWRMNQAESEDLDGDDDDTPLPLTNTELSSIYNRADGAETESAIEIRFVFGFVDTNRTGKVNEETFRRLMRTYMKFNDQDLAQLWTISTADPANIAPPNEYIELAKFEGLMQNTETVRKSFANADTNQDGWLDTLEFKTVFGKAHPDLMTRPSLVDTLFIKYDTNKDRHLSFLEFRQALTRDGNIRRPSQKDFKNPA